jgi:hypothetical protein
MGYFKGFSQLIVLVPLCVRLAGGVTPILQRAALGRRRTARILLVSARLELTAGMYYHL